MLDQVTYMSGPTVYIAKCMKNKLTEKDFANYSMLILTAPSHSDDNAEKVTIMFPSCC